MHSATEWIWSSRYFSCHMSGEGHYPFLVYIFWHMNLGHRPVSMLHTVDFQAGPVQNTLRPEFLWNLTLVSGSWEPWSRVPWHTPPPWYIGKYHCHCWEGSSRWTLMSLGSQQNCSLVPPDLKGVPWISNYVIEYAGALLSQPPIC